MNANVLRRFVTIAFIATLVMATGYYFYDAVVDRPPGDYEAEKGDMHLGAREFDQALEWFDAALRQDPEHLGALMGRSVAFIAQGRHDAAMAELDFIIARLLQQRDRAPNDELVRQALAVAYANRGNVHDREGRYEKALDDYVMSLRIDADVVDGPGLVDKIVHDPRPSTVRKRARYIYEQLKLPETERVLSIPELDARQRMYKP
jgi:tetratricopeptide (TPR) repeat protein